MKTEEIYKLDVRQVEESAVNPRSHYDKGAMQELKDSIAAKGMQQPIIVRKRGHGAEVICGHRRLKAVKELKLGTIDCIFREVGDDEVLDLQIIENVQRADLTPAEEAKAIMTLAARKLDVDGIAAALGKSRKWVHGRMRLNSLSKKASAALAAGELRIELALEIANLEDHGQQDEILRDTIGPYPEYATLGELRGAIQEHFVLDLSKAPFDTKADQLVKRVVACTICPKRTGNQMDLLEGFKEQDKCLDKACFDRKCSAALKVGLDAAKKSGRKVLNEKESKGLFTNWGDHDLKGGSKYLRLTDDCPYKGHKTWADALRNTEAKPVLAQRDGRAVELIERKEAEAVAKALGYEMRKDGQSPTTGRVKQTPAQILASRVKGWAERRKASGEEAAWLSLSKWSGGKNHVAVLKIIVLALLRECPGQGITKAAKIIGVTPVERKGWNNKKIMDYGDGLEKVIEGYDEEALWGVSVLLAAVGYDGPDMERTTAISKMLKGDVGKYAAINRKAWETYHPRPTKAKTAPKKKAKADKCPKCGSRFDTMSGGCGDCLSKKTRKKKAKKKVGK